MKVLFVCVGNSGRSQMAEAFARKLGTGVIEAESAGTMPADSLDPVVVEVMREIGYDMSGQHPKPLTPEMVKDADLIVSMGCGVDAEGSTSAACPTLFVPSEDWGLADPAGRSIDEVRRIRDEVRSRIEGLTERKA